MPAAAERSVAATYDNRLYLDVETTLLAKLNFTLVDTDGNTHTHVGSTKDWVDTQGAPRLQQVG